MSQDTQRILAMFTPAFVVLILVALVFLVKLLAFIVSKLRGDGKPLYLIVRTSVWNRTEHKAIDEYRVYRRWGPFYPSALDFEGAIVAFSTDAAARAFAKEHARVKSLDTSTANF